MPRPTAADRPRRVHLTAATEADCDLRTDCGLRLFRGEAALWGHGLPLVAVVGGAWAAPDRYLPRLVRRCATPGGLR